MCGLLLERTGAEAAAGVAGVAGVACVGAGVVGAGEDNNGRSPGVTACCVAAGMGKGGMGGIDPGVMGVAVIGIMGGGGIIDIIEGKGGVICDPIADPIGIFCLAAAGQGANITALAKNAKGVSRICLSSGVLGKDSAVQVEFVNFVL